MTGRNLGQGSRALAIVVALVAFGGCKDTQRRDATGGRAQGARAASAALVEEPVCRPTGAHGAHATLPKGCETCHPCGGNYGFPQDLVMPRGTTTAGGELVRGTAGSGTTTCSVGCHNPFGAPATTISWSQAGPLACTSCHAQVPVAAARSAHAVAGADATLDRSGCQGCHVLSSHLSGTVRIAVGDDGTTVEVPPGQPALADGACAACHDGAGKALGTRTPPLLVGWSSPAGDFHGSRAGTGWGGTLKAPYARGQGALSCAACHDAHASGNAFMLAATVNGAPVPAGTIDRQGVGAQALCESCHAGARHGGCMAAGCHASDPQPAGAPCFFCHGHEGVVNFTFPSPVHDIQHPNAGCNHCHADWMPAVERVAPSIATGGLVTVKDVGATTARIEWDTDEFATSYVEYGVGAPGSVAGTGALVQHHSVTLTGLAEATAYAFRVRSSDAMRNVTLSALQGFTTASAHAPLAPVLVPQPMAGTCDPTAAVTLAWSPVADPDGDPVEYRVVVDDDVAFGSPVVDSGWIAATSFATAVPAPTASARYYWHVVARDAAHDLWSPWSATDSFVAGQWDPAECW